MNNYLKTMIILLLLVSSVALIGLGIKGRPNEQGLAYQDTQGTEVGSPFESTNSNSRYALVASIVEHGTMVFNDELAKFSAPDIVYHEGNYFTIFTPGVSFAAIPFYILGRVFDAPQIGAYALNLVVVVINLFLVAYLARKWGAGFIASLMSGFLFVFATNSLPYALTLTQHQLSVTIILLAVINLMGIRTITKNIALGALYGAGLLIDIPIGIMLLPAVVYAIKKHITVVHTTHTKVKLNLLFVTLLLGLIPFLGLYGWYNQTLTGDPFKIGQFLGRSNYPAESIDPEVIKPALDPYANKLPYSTRGFLDGFYTLFLSNERSWLFYSPVVLFGFFGLILAYKKISHENKSLVILMLAIAAFDGLSYAMFGDPWGGWSFGPRYLIPAAALLATGIGVGIQHVHKKPVAAFVFFVLTLFSITITGFGTMSTNAIPPKVEAIALVQPIPYTYQYNIDLLKAGKSSSLVYNAYFSHTLTALEYTYLFILVVSVVFFSLFALTLIEPRRKQI